MPDPNRIDLSAMVLSGICVVHCLALPVLAALIPIGVIAGVEDDAWFHGIMLVVALPLSAFGLWQGWLRHGRALVPAVGVAGLLLMGWDMLPDDAIHAHSLTLPGVLLVALAHGLNIRGIRLRLQH